ncbi:heme-binding protein [Terrabacter aerolatus]|uniref:Heme-binding protein n=1 Tax=Terrabacter aerolatus TaxID=422442 RepID=A0A512D2K3_9MICO|nr:heme-binding protein [Terrabacter aerolatus]GEO30663.1 heme-binding protein [Terrabacter aerolatus]
MTEKQVYEIVRSYPEFELRRYAPHVVAEVVVTAPFEEAGNRAFRILFGYITGQNASSTTVAMTAPVIQGASTTIPMTAPVQQARTAEGSYAVAFVLPASLTLADAPVPTSPDVHLHERPAALAAARRYRGRWTEDSFEEHREALDRAVRAAGLTPVGAPRWARFDPPFMPWLLRRNEVVQDVAETDAATASS